MKKIILVTFSFLILTANVFAKSHKGEFLTYTTEGAITIVNNRTDEDEFICKENICIVNREGRSPHTFSIYGSTDGTEWIFLKQITVNRLSSKKREIRPEVSNFKYIKFIAEDGDVNISKVQCWQEDIYLYIEEVSEEIPEQEIVVETDIVPQEEQPTYTDNNLQITSTQTELNQELDSTLGEENIDKSNNINTMNFGNTTTVLVSFPIIFETSQIDEYTIKTTTTCFAIGSQSQIISNGKRNGFFFAFDMLFPVNINMTDEYGNKTTIDLSKYDYFLGLDLFMGVALYPIKESKISISFAPGGHMLTLFSSVTLGDEKISTSAIGLGIGANISIEIYISEKACLSIGTRIIYDFIAVGNGSSGRTNDFIFQPTIGIGFRK